MVDWLVYYKWCIHTVMTFRMAYYTPTNHVMLYIDTRLVNGMVSWTMVLNLYHIIYIIRYVFTSILIDTRLSQVAKYILGALNPGIWFGETTCLYSILSST